MAGDGGALKAGYAAADITPPVGVDLTGFIAREGPSTGVRDPLQARALVFEDGEGRRAALVTCDLIGLGRNLVAQVRRRAGERAGVPPDGQLFNCSHTHSGPETGVLTTIGMPHPRYLAELEERLVAVITAAARAPTPVRLTAGAVQVPAGLVVNRVYRRVGQPERYDRTLTVVQLSPDPSSSPAVANDGRPLATIVAFACHAVALGSREREVSADYVAPLRRALEAQGTGPVLYVNGCGGDVNPASMDARGREACDALGEGLAQQAQAALAHMTALPGADAGIRAACERVRLPFQALRSPEAAAALLEKGRQRLRETAHGSPAYRGALVAEVEYPLRLLRLHYGSEQLPVVEAEVQVLRIGPLALVALPGEIFSSLGRAIKDASPYPEPRTIVAGWANDNVGYVPDRDAYMLGGYEVDSASRYYGYPAGWAPEAGDGLVAAAVRLLGRLCQRAP